MGSGGGSRGSIRSGSMQGMGGGGGKMAGSSFEDDAWDALSSWGSSVSSFTSSLILPRFMTKDLGMSPLPPGASRPAFWSRCVRRFLRRVFAMAVGSGSSRRARASEENLSAALSHELPNLFRVSCFLPLRCARVFASGTAQ